MATATATASELQNQLDALRLDNRKKEAELRKQIAKKKRQEDAEFTKQIGKLARAMFPDLHTVDDFQHLFENLKIPQSKSRS